MAGRTRVIIAICLSAALTACASSMDLDGFSARWLEPGELETVDRTLARAQAGDWDAIRGSFHESLKDEDVGSDEVWSQIAEILRGADLEARDLIGVSLNSSSGRRSAVLTYEGPADGHWYALSIRLLNGDLYGFNVTKNSESLVAANAFRLSAIALPHVVLLVLGLVSVGLASLASFRVLRSAVPRRRLWAVLPWVMVGGISLNWTTGAFGLQLVKLSLPPITFTKAGPAAPWIFGFGLPLFALIALWKVSEAADGEDGPDLEDSPGSQESR